MAKSETATLLRNLDHRVAVIEQVLPTLATKDDLKGFPTKDDLKGFPTKDDLKGFLTKDDLKGLPTEEDPKGFALKTDLERFATRDDLREEGERSRRYMKVLIEAVHDTVNRALDVQAGHTQRLEQHGARLDGHDGKIGRLDVRVTALEHRGRRRR
jgi:hypothetical protein